MSDSLSPRRYERRGGIPSRADALAEDLNRLSDAAIQHISVVGGTVRRFGNSVCIEIPESRGGGDYRVVRFRLKAVYDDYLECKQLDGTTEVGPTVKVAKPYHLRRTPFHGKTINGITYTYTGVQSRTKTRASPSETENQVIVPAYQEAVTGYGGDEIYACKPSGGTGVKIGYKDEDVIWLDINNAGRAWAKVTE